MTITEYRDTHSWQDAISLAPKLVRLAEELPAAEQMGLGLQLHQAMVDLPAAIAHDLIEQSNTRMLALLRLVAALELVERIYPALDAAEARTAVDQLAVRLVADNFDERISSPAPVVATDEDGQITVNTLAEGQTADLPNPGEQPQPPASQTEGISVHVQPNIS